MTDNGIICGVYKITSPSGKIYIGQSKNIHSRWRVYKKPIEKLQKKQLKLYNSLKKHGWERHVFEIIETCELERLDLVEIYYIDFYKTYNTSHGLNQTIGGKSARGYIWSDEARKNGSKSSLEVWEKRRKDGNTKQSKEHRAKIVAKLIGKKRTEECKAKMRKPRSEQGKANISRGRLNRKNNPNYNPDEASKAQSEASKLGWINRKQNKDYNSEEYKKLRSEQQKRAWETRKKNQNG